MKGTIEAERLRRQGVDVVDLGAGEPDFPTPPHIIAAAHAALDKNFTKYTANMGVLELREAVGARYQQDYGVTYAPDEVIITAGGKQALLHAAMALFGPGDEVVTHMPGWPTIVEQIKLAGATPVDRADADRRRVRAARRHAARRRHAAHARHRHQLAGQSDRRAAVRSGGAEARARKPAKRDLWIVIDLCYEGLIYDARAAQPAEDLRRRDARSPGAGGIGVEGLRDDRLALRLAGGAETGGAGRQRAAEPRDVERQLDHAARGHRGAHRIAGVRRATCARSTRPRRDQVLAWLAEEPRLECAVPQGAFYLFPSVSEFLSPDRHRTSLDFADALLAEEHVVTTAGEAFDTPGFIRLSYATSLERLREGVTRLIRFARK